MKMMMLTYETRDEFAARTDEGRRESYWAEWRTFIRSMQEEGVLAYPGNVLQPEGASVTVTVRDGDVRTSAGDAVAGAEDRPQLSGYFILEVENADEAMRWASLAPAAASGSVELRPVW